MDKWPASLRRLNMKIKDVMTRDVITCSPGDNVVNIVKLMGEKKVSGLPVVEGGRIVGIVTEEDILKLLAVPEGSRTLWLPSPLEVILEIPFRELMQLRMLQKSVDEVKETTVGEIMNKDIIAITPGDDIEDAASLMVKNRINRLPVVEGDKLVGIVARDDIIQGLGGKSGQ